MKSSLAPLSLLLLALPAAAQDAPAKLRPARDAVVTYTVQAPGQPQPQTVQMAWLAAGEMMRIEPQGAPGWMLVDRKAGKATMVVDSQKMMLPLAPEAAAMLSQEIPAGTRFERQGADTVAGQPCTNWRVAGAQADSVSCLTEDGVLLRSVTSLPQGMTTRMEATAVSLAAQDPKRFQLPAGYTVMEMPAAAAPAPAR